MGDEDSVETHLGDIMGNNDSITTGDYWISRFSRNTGHVPLLRGRIVVFYEINTADREDGWKEGGMHGCKLSFPMILERSWYLFHTWHIKETFFLIEWWTVFGEGI
jgi:hypothetical protein